MHPVGRYANAGIDDTEAHELSLFVARDLQRDLATAGRELDRVREQIENRLLDLALVRFDHPDPIGDRQVERDAVPRIVVHFLERIENLAPVLVFLLPAQIGIAVNRRRIIQSHAIDGGNIRRALEIHDLVILGEQVVETALRHTAIERHLTALETGPHGRARARVLALVTATSGLAKARADAATDAN